MKQRKSKYSSELEGTKGTTDDVYSNKTPNNKEDLKDFKIETKKYHKREMKLETIEYEIISK